MKNQEEKKEVFFKYFDKDCVVKVNPLNVVESSILFKYGCSSLYVAIVRKLVGSDVNINSIKNFRVLYEEKGYSNNTIPFNRLKREIYEDKYLLRTRLIDKCVRPQFPYTAYKYDINVLILSNNSEDLDIASVLGVNIALKIYFQDEFNISVPFRISFDNYKVSLLLNKSLNLNDMFIAFNINGIASIEFTTRHPVSVCLFEKQISQCQFEIEKQFNEICDLFVLNDNAKALKLYDYDHHKYISFNLFDNHYKDVQDILLALLSGGKEYNSGELIKDFKNVVEEYVFSKHNEIKFEKNIVELLIYLLSSRAFCSYYIVSDKRIDQRKYEEFRDLKISCDCVESNVLNVSIERGNTQVFNTCTVGQLDPKFFNEFYKLRNVFVHYNFNGFSANEIVINHGFNRREIGHGFIIENSLLSVFKPTVNYAFRFFTEVVSADGSTSLAGTMASGILASIINNNKSILTGISLGLLHDGKHGVILLCDITEIEDYYCLVDAKIVFDQDGNLVLLHIDSKTTTISFDMLFDMIHIACDSAGNYTKKIKDWFLKNEKIVEQFRSKLNLQMCVTDKTFDKVNIKKTSLKFGKNQYFKKNKDF